MTVQDVFTIKRRGTVATGVIDTGSVRIGDVVRFGDGDAARVDGIEVFRKSLDEAGEGQTVGLLFKDVEKGRLSPGDVLRCDGTEFVV